MGEHKRKKLAPEELRQDENWLDDMLLPVDFEIFKFVSQTYQAAARMTMPVENPSARPILEMNGKQYSFSDMPINRGMLAAKGQLNELEAKNHQAYLNRLMHFGEILEARERLGDLIREGNEPGALMISEAVMYAAATAKMFVSGEHMGYDIDDVVQVAHDWAASHPDTE
ncbi:hypothetical protein [Sideroxyarcus sp. TK5]